MHRIFILVLLCLAFLIAACGPETTPIPPIATRTPLPTFTPAPPEERTPVDPAAAATAQAAAQAAAANEGGGVAEADPATGDQSGVEAQPPEPADTSVPPTPAPQLVINTSIINIRGGPGTNYAVIGTAAQGERFTVTGRNQAGNWWEIDYSGQRGWAFDELVVTEGTGAVAVADSVPAPPPTPVPAPPTATPQPQPQPEPAQPEPAEPEPAPPQQQYEFNKALVQGCFPNAGVTYVEGTVYRDHVPTNGYKVAFSYAPDGPIVASITAGPHDGYSNWNPGFYSHILQTDGPREGNWFFWIVDDSGNRISQIANVQTHGEAGEGKCQQAVVDFDTN